MRVERSERSPSTLLHLNFRVYTGTSEKSTYFRHMNPGHPAQVLYDAAESGNGVAIKSVLKWREKPNVDSPDIDIAAQISVQNHCRDVTLSNTSRTDSRYLCCHRGAPGNHWRTHWSCGKTIGSRVRYKGRRDCHRGLLYYSSLSLSRASISARGLTAILPNQVAFNVHMHRVKASSGTVRMTRDLKKRMEINACSWTVKCSPNAILRWSARNVTPISTHEHWVIYLASLNEIYTLIYRFRIHSSSDYL